MFVFGARPYRARSGLDIDGRQDSFGWLYRAGGVLPMLFCGYSCSEDLFSRYFAGKSVSVCWDLGQSLLAPFTNFTKSKSTKAEQYKKVSGAGAIHKKHSISRTGPQKTCTQYIVLEGFCWSYTASQCCFWTKFQRYVILSGACARVPVLVKTVQQDISRTGPPNSYTR